MEFNEKNTVASIVAENIKAAHVFKKFGIDFCCGGGRTIVDACKKNNVDINTLAEELKKIDQDVSTAVDFNKLSLNELIDYIVNKHHSYVVESIPLLLQYGEKVTKVHGHHYKELPRIYELLQMVVNELKEHMRKEELILFPFIKKLEGMKGGKEQWSKPSFVTVMNPIRAMETEHDSAGETFKKVAKLTNSYTPPKGACNTFKAYYSKLAEFENDLHLHIHLENNILHPKAMQLEAIFQPIM